jgi:GH35 family endo-1,4-beta-xylanase
MDAFGDGVMVDWFEQARANLPAHKLYINDYSILSGGGRNFAHQDHYQQTIQYLQDANAPIDGIGLQSHFGNSPTSISRIYDIIERFHQAFPDLKIRSTEFDVNTTDEALQADFTRDFLTIFFSHPATVGVQNWGFWAGAHWNPNAAMYTQSWQEKPNAVAWKQAIYDTWWNDFSGVSSDAGEFSSRGFYGKYKVTVMADGQQVQSTIELLPGGESEFTLQLAPQ